MSSAISILFLWSGGQLLSSCCCGPVVNYCHHVAVVRVWWSAIVIMLLWSGAGAQLRTRSLEGPFRRAFGKSARPNSPGEVLSASHPSDKFENEVLMKWDWQEGLAAMAFLHPTQYRHLSVCAQLFAHYGWLRQSNSSDGKAARIVPGFVKVYATYLTRREAVPFVNLEFLELRKQNDLILPLASLGPQHGQGQVKTPLLLHGRHGERQMQVPLLARQGV